MSDFSNIEKHLSEIVECLKETNALLGSAARTPSQISKTSAAGGLDSNNSIEPSFYQQKDDITYIDEGYKHLAPKECAVLILYARTRENLGAMSKDLFKENLRKNSFSTQGFRWDALEKYIHIDPDGNYEIRDAGIKKAKALLDSKK